jgi:pimeloyl-ACP methyl ester carboxylesterase
VNVRRDYAPCRFGQLHYSLATPKPPTGKPPLFCFHQSPISGAQYALFQHAAAAGRAVYCPDTPGFGSSDAPPRVPTIADYACAMADLIDHLKCGPVDALGFHTGTLVAMELAILRPDLVRRLSITSLALFDDDLRERNRKIFGQPRPLFTDPGYVGRFYRQEVVSADARISERRRFEMFVERMRAGPNSWWGPEAVFGYDTAARAKLVTQPVLLLVMQDTLANATRDAAALFPNATVVERLDWHGPTAWDEKAPEVAAEVARHLDAPA